MIHSGSRGLGHQVATGNLINDDIILLGNFVEYWLCRNLLNTIMCTLYVQPGARLRIDRGVEHDSMFNHTCTLYISTCRYMYVCV